MQAVIAPFETWGDLIAGAAATAFPPATSIMGAILLLVRGARRVSEAFDMITDLFNKLGHFALRLDSYKGVSLSAGMKTIIVKVLVNFLRVCTISQDLLSKGSFRSRLKNWAKNVLTEDTKVNSLMGELEDLTSQEQMMFSAHGLKITDQALRNTEELLERDNQRHDQEQLRNVKAALQPVAASSQVFSFTNENRMSGSGAWIEDKIRRWWQGKESLLWLHGGPGVGKSHLASKIITDLANGELCGAPIPLVASFFCRNNDVDLRSINKALRTLAWQIATQSPGFTNDVEEYCLREDVENTYTLWKNLLIRQLAEQSSVATCFVIDGLDEMEAEELDVFFGLLEKDFSKGDPETRPNLRFVILSRDSVRSVLEEHSLDWIPEIEVGNNENKEDLFEYVSQKLRTTKLLRSSPELRGEVIEEISREAEGLWEWANLVIKGVLRCRTKEQIRKCIRNTPRGISAMLDQELQRLGKELSTSEESSHGEYSSDEVATQVDHLNTILSFVTLAQKPLNLWQLQVILHVIFKEKVLNLEDDIRSLYSSLFQIRRTVEDNWDTVLLRHSSFYEYFRNSKNSGQVHVNFEKTETNFLYVILETYRGICTPQFDRDTEKIEFVHFKDYADSFLPWHLKSANPESSGRRRQDISTLFENLFTHESLAQWLVMIVSMRNYDDYRFYPSSRVSRAGKFWLQTRDYSIANSRAQLVLNWLIPETKQMFEDNARLMEDLSDACPFTVLFSFMVHNWVRLWLAPDKSDFNKKEEGGWPATIPRLLQLYRSMAVANEQPEHIVQVKLLSAGATYTEISTIVEAARLHKVEHNAMWNLRVGQALLMNGNFREARQQFLAVFNDEKIPNSFNEQQLSIVHRDMARACTQIGRHEEALRHAELAETIEPPKDHNSSEWDRAERLLTLAQLKFYAWENDSALSMANKAWEEISKADENNHSTTFFSLFDIFLKLRKFERLEGVLRLAAQKVQSSNSQRPWTSQLAWVICFFFLRRAATMYRVCHLVFKKNDQDCLARFAEAMSPRLDDLPKDYWILPELRYYTASLLFEKGRLDLGIQGWCQVLISDNRPKCSLSYNNVCERALAHLVSVCLGATDISSCEGFPITFESAVASSETCLVISSWLQNHGYFHNARFALHGCVEACVSLLLSGAISSNGDGSAAKHAFVALFEVFLIDSSGNGDLDAALYWIKQDQEQTIKDRQDEIRLESDPRNGGSLDIGKIYRFEGFNNLFIRQLVTRCSVCVREAPSIHNWYYCRSCPFKTCCQECSQNQPVPKTYGTYKCPGVCDDEHDFFYTGGTIRQEERVPEGMLPLVSSEGERSAIRIEDWMDRLVKRWDTADSTFDGGLSAWCMSVLPEPQATRWARMFN